MKPKISLRNLFWLVLIIAMPSRLLAEEDNIRFVRPFPRVMYAESRAKELKPVAEEVARLTGASAMQAANFNPVCCIWLELTGTPSPGQPGYIILHQSGGTMIQASNVEQMQAALKRWKGSSRRIDGAIAFPEGLSTNYEIVK